MYFLTLLSRVDNHGEVRIQQIIGLQEVVVESQHGWMEGETVKGAAFVRQGVHAFSTVALKRIATPLCRRAADLKNTDACEFLVCEVDLLGCVDVPEDHVAVFEDVINEMFDRGIFLAREEGCASAQLNSGPGFDVTWNVTGLRRSVSRGKYW
jgi:hypothetical protein